MQLRRRSPTLDLSMVVCRTDGTTGMWSNVKAAVQLVKATVGNLYTAIGDSQPTAGELRVYFKTSTWDVNSQGLIHAYPVVSQ